MGEAATRDHTRSHKISAILIKYMVKHKIIQDSSNILEGQLYKIIENINIIEYKERAASKNAIGREKHKTTQEMTAKLGATA